MTVETRDPLALESQVCFALSLASRSIVNAYRPVLEPLKLTHPQYLVMLALWQHQQLSLKRLAELLGLEPATASPLAKRLEALGYVQRERDAGDERTLRISLTTTGRALRETAETIPATMMRRLGLDEGELLGLHDAMVRVIGAAQRAGAGDGPPPG
ncbi:MAG: MarR family transcriptional regulator, organic hydroperoxide resistance regulator [Microbacteriaceae bacterium]|nr:MarR family transcriptional regulator, organic hydroperoxide resistance regulator [Microbacteriaceae bacterium]